MHKILTNCQRELSGQVPQNLQACIDPILYYVSLNNPNQCNLCVIENCKYCIEYSSQNPEYNSRSIFLSANYKIYYDDIVLGCSKCYEGFQYNFDTGKCEPVEVSPCIYSIVKDQIKICLQTDLQYGEYVAIQYGNCQNYQQYCLSCIIDMNQKIFCILCEPGYYAKGQTGICYLCTQEQAIECYESSRVVDDHWMDELKAFYYYLMPDNQIITNRLISDGVFQTDKSCIQDYEIFDGHCIAKCPSSCKQCKIFKSLNVCASCETNNYGVSVRSIKNNKCLQCPQYCEYCVPQDQNLIKKWNPYFDQDSYLTHRCLKVKEDLDMYYINPNYGFVKYCTKFNKCALEVQILYFDSQIVEIQKTDYDYLNFRSINSVYIQYQLLENTDLSEQKILQNKLKKNIYSVDLTKIKITSNNQTVKNMNLQINSFNEIYLQDISFKISSNFQLNTTPLTFDYNDFYLLQTQMFSQGEIEVEFNILLNHLKFLNIDQVLMSQLFVQNQIMINQLPYTEVNTIKIAISNLIIQHSTFLDVIFFNFNAYSGQQMELSIQNLVLQNVTMINSIFLNFTSSDTVHISIQDLIIQNCSLINSTLFIQPHNAIINITDMLINSTTILQSVLCQINTKIIMQNIQLMYLDVQNSMLFLMQNFYGQNEFQFSLNNFIFEQSSYTNTSIFNFKINSVFFVSVIFQNISHINIKQKQKQQITAQTLYLLSNFVPFEDQSFSQIIINRFSAISDEKNIKNIIKLDLECNNQPSESNFIYISGFQSINISQMIIKHQLMIDRYVLKIYFPESELLPTINLSDLDFISNVLLKQENDDNLPLISISTNIQLNIVLKNLEFSHNFINYYVQQQILLGNLIYINCIQSDVIIESLQIKTNLISNSTSTYISINSNTIKFTNLSTKDINKLDAQYFINYFNISGQSESLLALHKQIFSIKSSYGIGLLTAQNITVLDSIFENITSLSSSIFTIIGKNQFTIILNNLQITNSSSSITSELTQFGCFLIDASKSQSLNLILNMIQVNYVINKLQSAFLTLISSTQNNKIQITNSKFNNVISLKNSVFDLNLGNSNIESNKIKIKNVTILTDKQQFLSYFKLIQQVKSYTLTQLIDMNAVILISSSFTYIQGLQIRGYFNIPILQLINCNVITLADINFSNILTIQSLMILSSNLLLNQRVIIQQIQINKVQQLILAKFDQNISICPKQISYSQFIDKDCSIDYSGIEKVYKQNTLGQQTDCDGQILAQLAYKIDGLISITYSKIEFLNIRDLIIMDSQCSECNFGLINIKLERQISNINLYNFKCRNNIMSNYGCVYLVATSDNQQKIQIYNSVFENNLCKFGCALTVLDVPLQLQNLRIINNLAKFNGGGILYLSKTYNMNISSVYFINNTAILGSAIYIEQDFTSDNFRNNSIVLNNANLQIQEQPTQINLYFYQIQIKSVKYDENLFQIHIPDYNQLSSTQIQQQYLQIPSNQYISQYKIFNSETRIRQHTNMSIRFKAENQYNEQITMLINTKCILSYRDYNLTSQLPISQFKVFAEIQFDNLTLTYNLDQTLFIVNPYQERNIIFQVLLEFPSFYNKQFRFQLNLRSYFCQIGEYLIDNGCQLCQIQQGYYSVKANQSICQKIDTTKVQTITESEIQLKEGFWRPKYESDLIEICLKKQSDCTGGWIPGAASCSQGHIGALCEECDLQNTMGNGKYLKVSVDQMCLPCYVSWRPIISILFLSFWSIISIILITKSIENANHRFHLLQRTSRHYVILHKFNLDQAGCLIKIGLNQMLIISSIFTYQIGLQVNLVFIQDISQTTLANSYNLDCLLADYSDHVQTIYLRIIVLFIIPLIYINIYFLQYLIVLFFKTKRFSASELYTAFIYMFVITQPDIIKYTGSLLASRSISGIKWIQANVSYLYETQQHQNWIYFCILPILFLWCIAIPLNLLYQLYQNKNKLKFRSIRRKYSYLYDEYKESSYYWETVKIIQRQLQILVLTLFEQNIILKSSFLLIIQSIYLLVLTYKKPFNSEEVNKLEQKSVTLCLYIIMMAVCIFSIQTEDQAFLLYLFQVLLIVLIAFNLLPILFKLIYCYTNQYLNKLCVVLERILSMHPIMRNCLQICLSRRLQRIQRKEIVNARFARMKQHLIRQAKSIIQLRINQFNRDNTFGQAIIEEQQQQKVQTIQFDCQVFQSE